jgi:hypothetical protein
MPRRTGSIVTLAFAVLLVCTAMQAQDLANEIVVSFPPETTQVEFSRPAELRKLPSYAGLRQRYLGQRLLALEASVSQLGIRESNIDQVVLGWQPVKKEAGVEGQAVRSGDADSAVQRETSRNTWPTRMDGLMAGRFDLSAIAHDAAARRVPSVALEDGTKAYCFWGAPATCVVFPNESLAIFGSRESLSEILDSRNGRGPNLAASGRLLELLHNAPTEASVWGIAVGPAITRWFEGWLPGQQDVKLDWSHMFEKVETLTYSVEADEKVRLDVKLDCKTPEAAGQLVQLFQGLKLIQQIIWQRQNPNRFNPVKALDVEADDSRVSLTLITDYAAIQDLDSFPLRSADKN